MISRNNTFEYSLLVVHSSEVPIPLVKSQTILMDICRVSFGSTAHVIVGFSSMLEQKPSNIRS